MKNAMFVQTAIGRVGIAENGEAITDVFVGDMPGPPKMVLAETPLLLEAARQLLEYARGERQTFDLPLAPTGTAFERSVWRELERIPYGETRSYAQIAEAVGSPKGFRAVGRANGRNRIAIVIPCHRVIGSNGKLTGFAGGLPVKESLLALEGICRS